MTAIAVQSAGRAALDVMARCGAHLGMNARLHDFGSEVVGKRRTWLCPDSVFAKAG